MDAQLQALLDRTQIVETITRLFVATDNRDWPEVEACFADSVLFDMSSLGAGAPRSMKPAEITAGWDAGLKPLKAIHHQAGNHIVRVAATTAEAFCYAIATHYLPNKTGANTRTFVGSYDFGLVKRADRWLIDRFRFNLKYVDGNADLAHS